MPRTITKLLRRGLCLGLVAVSLLLGGCGHNPSKVPVVERSEGDLDKRGYYTVRKGDTLFSIAWKFGLEYHSLARANGIRSPYTIHPGDKLVIRGQAGSKQSSASSKPPANTQKKPTVTPSYSKGESWRWPVNGTLAKRYSSSGKIHKGIDINGKIGQPVLAAKSGKVVYAGTGLKAYGLLVIIKHDERYLSAYAFNRKSLVKEGQTVKAGQRIADMGTKDGKQPMLHFEIRRDGNPIDPLRLLPKK